VISKKNKVALAVQLILELALTSHKRSSEKTNALGCSRSVNPDNFADRFIARQFVGSHRFSICVQHLLHRFGLGKAFNCSVNERINALL
jgi:hypothetical protein